MLPYTQIQIAYACATSIAGFILWGAARRIVFLAAHPRWRTLAVGVSLAILAVGCGFCFESGFASIAVLFYAGSLTLPALLLWQQRGARARDWPSIALAIFAPLVASYAAFVAPNDLRVVERKLAFQAWPASATPFTLVQISDLQTVGPCARQDEAVARINAQEPDLIAVCGDYIAGPFYDPQPSIDAARAFFGALHSKYGIVCVKGHSETRALRERVLAGLPVRYLDDEEFTLELSPGQRLRVIGLGYDEPKFAPRRESGTLTVVVSHVPDQSTSLIGREVDLHLAGHTHGGQIAIPGYGALITLSSLPHEFARGLFGFGDHWLSVTPGIGMEGYHAPRVRLFCPPEIDVLRLEGGGKPFEWTAPPLTSRARAGNR
jgi:predicted MPP superfamily phosphohydrolase